MANVLKGYRGNNTGSFKEVESITKNYDTSIIPTKEERIKKKEERAVKQDWSDKKRLRKGLNIDTDKTIKVTNYDATSKTYDSSIKENVAQYITKSERQGYSPNLSTDASATPSTIDKSRYKNVFEKGDYVGTVRKREGKALNEIFQSNPAGLNINVPKINLPNIDIKLPSYKGSNLQKSLRKAGEKIKNIGKGSGTYSSKRNSYKCPWDGNC
ncbi:hypothetical protein H8D85_02635 [bacterium]|nr:hypothetical protein [bacterium]